jgi:hypothetical protein
MMKNPSAPAAALALLVFFGPALAAETGTPDYKAGYEAGYQAAMQALRSPATVPPVAGTPSAAASAPSATPAAQGPGGASPAAEPRDWWNHSALLAPKLDPALVHHAEVQLSATGLSGNDSGHAVRGSAKLFSRTGQWTNELIATVDNRNIVQAGGAVNRRDYKMLQESVRYDLTQKLYASAGFILERDDVNYIDRRTTVLAGAGYYLIDTPKLRINTFAALGRLKENYLQPVPALIGLDGRSSGLIYLYETLDWQLAENWSLQQGWRYIRDLSDSGQYGPDPGRPGQYRADSMVKRYRTVGNLALAYQLSPRSTVSLGVESRYDSNPWPDVKPRDTTRRLSLNLMY